MAGMTVERVVNNASSEMRSPTRFAALAANLEDPLRSADDETLRPFEERRAGDYDAQALIEYLAEEGNFFLVFDGEEAEGPEFVIGDPEDTLRAVILITDPVPFEAPLTADDTFFVAREGLGRMGGGWDVREYDPNVLEVLFGLIRGEEEKGEEEEED